MVPPPVKSRLFMFTACAGAAFPANSSVTWDESETLGNAIGAPPAVTLMVVIWLDPLPLVVMVHPVVNPSNVQPDATFDCVMLTVVVPGIGLGSCGVG